MQTTRGNTWLVVLAVKTVDTFFIPKVAADNEPVRFDAGAPERDVGG